MPTAKERKKRVQEASRQAVVSRRTSRVKSWVDPGIKMTTLTHPSFAPDTREPHGLSPEARWMDLRPKGYSPLVWMGFFTDDESLWPVMVEEALYDLIPEGGGDNE